ncbi:Wound-induced protein 1 [Apostasia shenzhenica]|uniref:Wound-induced protein 1 n=1 Tax=Apostasia shenzhenica TaxID=1088818 RepID=A0A2I0BGG8_9ASPA|nr:Wound-induced protein 1 [Apostasia shenzhenica]
MKRLLTGGEDDGFQFVLYSIEAFGSTVLAEGSAGGGSTAVFWVHAWTVADGVITQVREYFNSSVTVARVATGVGNCKAVWKSRLAGAAGKSLPGLVLAI